MGGDEVVHRRLRAALLVRDAGERESHLGAGERAHQHEVVGASNVRFLGKAEGPGSQTMMN